MVDGPDNMTLENALDFVERKYDKSDIVLGSDDYDETDFCPSEYWPKTGVDQNEPDLIFYDHLEYNTFDNEEDDEKDK
jgi:hypothetical protein